MNLFIFLGALLLFVFILRHFSKKLDKRPEIEKWWTTIYYGARGSGKSQHQAVMVMKVFEYLDWLYSKKLKPKQLDAPIHRAIVYSVQKFNPEIEKKYAVYGENKKTINNPLGYLYYWQDAKDLRYCPRAVCWRGKTKHRLHGAYLIFDDMATILPADNWQRTPVWMRKMFAQARHFGIRILANMQDPFSVDVNFRRYCDMAFRFRKIFSTKDPDETKAPIKTIFGFYIRRRIKAEILWKMGDMTDEEISIFKARQEQENKVNNTNLFYDVWKASWHMITRKTATLYDTNQDVPEYRPAGFLHEEFGCIDPKHDHEDKKAPNYCGYRKAYHELV